MPQPKTEAWTEPLLEGMEDPHRKELSEFCALLDEPKRNRLLLNKPLWNTVLALAPQDRTAACQFLFHEGAIDLFGPQGYSVEPTLGKIVSYLKTARNPLPLPRLIRKLRFYMIKHGPLHMRGFIEQFAFDHLMRAFTTRVLHMLTLGEKLAFNIPLCLDPKSTAAPWGSILADHVQKCWLVSYIDRPQGADPSPQALEISSQFNRFTDLNYRALYYLNVHEKTVEICQNCLRAVEDMLRCYLALFHEMSGSAAADELRSRSLEADIFYRIDEEIQTSLRQELNLPPKAQLPLDAPLPPHTEAVLMAYDGEKANRYIQSQFADLSVHERSSISAAELINILHQKGLALGPQLFDRLRQAGGRVISEISHAGINHQAARTNDFISFIDLRQTRRGGSLPFPVRVIVDAVTRNANIIPDTSRLKLLIYSSELETHLDIRIGGHSARVHYSLAPPERGGRFALLYAEGGNDEGNQRRLQLMSRTFSKAGLKVSRNGQLLEAIYDKDCGATTLDAIRQKAALGLQILNSMPDLDYALAGFNGTYTDDFRVDLYGYFDKTSIDQILDQWAQHCFENGFFFLDHLRPVKKGEDHFYARSELYWDGRGPYADPYQRHMRNFTPILEAALRESLERVAMPLQESHIMIGQAFFDRLIDRENLALRHSLLLLNERGFVKANPVIGELRQHPVTLFVDYLKDDQRLPLLAHTAQLAAQVFNLGSLEDLGKLGGLWVSRLRISVIKDVLSFFLLRVPESQHILLAFATIGEDPLPVPFIDRVAEILRPTNVITKTDWIALILNLFGYRVDTDQSVPVVTWELIRGYLEQPNPPDLDVGMVSIPGIITSPGIVTGRLRAGVAERPSGDYQDGLLIDHYLTPDDDPKIQAARGVLITSGGELSHAAIRTREFQKPSLILKDVHYDNGTINYLPHYSRALMTCYPYSLRDITVHTCYCPPGNVTTITARDGDLLRLDADRGHVHLLANREELQQAYQLTLSLEQYPDQENLWQDLYRQLQDQTDPEVLLFLLSEWILVQDAPAHRVQTILRQAQTNPHHGNAVDEYLRQLVSDIDRRTDTLLQRQRVKLIRSNSLMELFCQLGFAVSRCERLQNLQTLFAQTGQKIADSCNDRLFSLCSLASEKIEKHRPTILAELSALAARSEQIANWEPQLLLECKRVLERARDAGLDWDPLCVELTELLDALLAKKNAQILTLLEHRPEGPFLIPKDRLDTDYRPLVGGKASHSGEILLALQSLEDADLCVPQGFAVTTCLWKSCERTMSSVSGTLMPELVACLRQHLIDELKNYRALLNQRHLAAVAERSEWVEFLALLGSQESLTAERLQAAVEDFCNWLEAILEIQQDQILLAFAGVYGRFAVRSSGIREDSLEESFAGQKLTVLNVFGPQHLVKAIWEVFASGAEAVLLEQLIPAVVSGVAFSVHPGTGNFSQILINSAYGLGEGVVSGQVDPDTLIVDKKSGRLLGQPVVGHKLVRIMPAPRNLGGGTLAEAVPPELQRQICMRAHNQQQLVNAIRLLESHFNYPLDVEWAVDPLGRLFILQSRPITTLWQTLGKGKSFYEQWVNKIANVMD